MADSPTYIDNTEYEKKYDSLDLRTIIRENLPLRDREVLVQNISLKIQWELKQEQIKFVS